LRPARAAKAFRYAVREEEFLNVFGAGVLLVVIGTVTYTLGRAGTSSTRSTSPSRRSRLRALEILRRLGLAFVEVRKEERADRDPGRDRPAST
jgi:hypothetical protein